MNELFYEQKQNLNVITRFLHAQRYRQLLQFTSANMPRDFKILDIGCGPGGAYQALRKKHNIDYFGVDIKEDFISAAQSRYPEARFEISDVTRDEFDFKGFDLVIALETFEHIPEGKLVRVIERLSESGVKYLLCSVPIEIGPSVAIKNFGSKLMGYDRLSGNVMQTLNAAMYNLNALPPHGVAHLGFNWIWLEQTLRQSFKVNRSTSLPSALIPKFLAPSVFFECESYSVGPE